MKTASTITIMATALVLLAVSAVRGQQYRALDAIVAAYPDLLAGHDASVLRWRDGTTMPVGDGNDHKTFDQLLRRASVLDQVKLPYPRGRLAAPPAPEADPGRFRNTAFFTKMYGECRKGEVSRR